MLKVNCCKKKSLHYNRLAVDKITSIYYNKLFKVFEYATNFT